MTSCTACTSMRTRRSPAQSAVHPSELWRRAAALGSHAGMDGSGDATGLPSVFAIRLPPMHRVCVRVQTRTAAAARGDPRREQLNRRSSLNHNSTRVTGGRMPAFERGLQRICVSLCWAVSQRARCAPCSLLSRRPLRLVEAPNIPHCPERRESAMQCNARQCTPLRLRMDSSELACRLDQSAMP
jgi:hypothetical protein